MTAERWQRVKGLFQAALECQPEERAAFVASIEDMELKVEIESLLASTCEIDSIIDGPPVIPAAEFLNRLDTNAILGQRIGPYRLVRLIGTGGMGSVYLAARCDQQYEKQVAIKLIHPGLNSSHLVARFRQERQVLANLDHPNIARLLDGGTTDSGSPFLVMEHVEGTPIDRYCKAHQLSTAERLLLFRQVCAAVHYAHQNLVVHRDLKPGNILVTEGGTPKLLDFGIAKLLRAEIGGDKSCLTRGDWRPMTPEYASPEQVSGEPITTATDVYSLGVLLYELLTEHRPYETSHDSPIELARAICEQEPEKPSTIPDLPDRTRRSLTGDLDNIVLKAMHKQPQRRYASVEQFSEDVRRHLEGLPVVARKDTWSYRASKFLQRHKMGVAAIITLVVVLLAGLVATMWQARVARAEKAVADRRFQDVHDLANDVLFDIHDAVQNLPGSTPARKLIVQKVLEYLGRVEKDAAGNSSLQLEIVQAYLKIGRVQGNPNNANLGDTKGALASDEKARAIAENLVSAHPNDVAARRWLATSYEDSAGVLADLGRIREGVQNLRKAAAIFDVLRRTDSDSIEDQLNLAWCLLKLGDRLGNPKMSNLGDRTEALEKYRESTRVAERVLSRNPGNVEARREICLVHERIGGLLVAKGDLTEAVKQYEAAKAMAEQLSAAYPQNADFRRNVAVELGRLAETSQKTGDSKRALRYYREALEDYERLSSADPGNSQARRDLALGHEHVAQVLPRPFKVAETVREYQTARDIYEKRLKEDPANMEKRADLGRISMQLANALTAEGREKEARPVAAQGLALMKEQADAASATPQNINDYAWYLLTVDPKHLRNASMALQYAARAVQESGAPDFGILDTLATAYFETGNVHEAIETEQKALALLPEPAPGAPEASDRRDIKASLKRFRGALNPK